MLPIKLTIEGLYSYQEKQVVDFENLTRAGLFGIFGETGSGKSSILEAISFVLYGETERMNNRDNRAYNMMNLKSNRLFIEFEFSNQDNKIYKASREVKRNSKNFQKISTSQNAFYEYSNNDWVPLDISNAESLLGLTYENFKRTIIIPQGQFNEFIQLTDKDRSNMLKEIFELERFDLAEKAKVLNQENLRLLSEKRGALSLYEHITEELIERLKTSADEASKLLQATKNQYNEKETVYLQLKSAKEIYDHLKRKKEQFLIEKERENEFDKLEQKLNLYETVFRTFDAIIKQENDFDKDLQKIRQSLVEGNSAKAAVVDKLEQLNKKLNDLLPYYQQLTNKRQEENDLLIIKDILTAEKGKKILEDRLKNGEEILKNEEKEIEEIIKNIEQQDHILEKLKNNKPDTGLLLELGNWYAQQASFKEILNRQKEIQDKAKTNYESALKNLKDKGFGTENFIKIHQTNVEKLKEEKEQTLVQKSRMEVQHKLSEYAEALHDGAPCPLCGSEHHPHIAQAHNVSNELNNLQNRIKAIEQEQENLQTTKNEFDRLQERISQYKNNLTEEAKNYQIALINFQSHLKTFHWDGFTANNIQAFEELKKNIFNINKQIELQEKLVKNLRQQKEETDGKLKKYREGMLNFKMQHAGLHSQVVTNKNNLKVLSADNFSDSTPEETDHKYAALKNKNDKTEEEHKLLTNHINDATVGLSGIESGIKLLSEQENTLSQKLKETETEIKNRLANHHLSIEIVQDILAQQTDVKQSRKAIMDFRINFENLKTAINEAENKLKQISFNPDTLETIEQEFTAIKELLDVHTKNHHNKEKEKLDTEKAMLKKKELEQELSQYEHRNRNLSIMLNLFKSAGFVNYVSSIYLKQLCHHANIRFSRMTRNQLSLQVNEDNSFDIIDYLNEGHTRSIKTLSGGQSFQASLSLALALAESVQAKSKAKRNFFFIDEGFGTQDQESVNIVFDTLLSLNKENKIVGIISHVNELKERIPLALNVIKDEARGSLIETNY